MHDTKEEECRHRQILTLGGRLPVAMVAACPFPANRGTPIRVQQMGEALVDLGYDVHVVTYHIGTERPLPGMTVHRTRPLRFYQDFSAGPNYAKLLLLDDVKAMLDRGTHLGYTPDTLVDDVRSLILTAHSLELLGLSAYQQASQAAEESL